MAKGLRAAGRSIPKGNRPKSPLSKKLRAEVNRLEAAAQLPLLPPPPKRDPIGELLTAVAPTVVLAARERRAQAMADLEADEAKEAAELGARPPVLFIPGDEVRMTAKWLKLAYGSPDLVYERVPPHSVACGRCGTCRYCVPRMSTAPAIPDERFTVQACPCEGCASGRLVAVPHKHPQMIEWYGPLRHILATNVERAQLAPTGPIRKEDHDALLAQVGMRVDDDGNYFLRPPWEL